MSDAFPLREVEHDPSAPLPEAYVGLLADLLRYCAEVMIGVFPKRHPGSEAPAGTEMDHSHTAAFENAVGLLERNGLVAPILPAEHNAFYRLSVALDRFPARLQERYDSGELTFDDFNRALEAPLHLDNQSEVRASASTTARIIEGQRALGLVAGPPGKSAWTDEVLLHVWFLAYGMAVEGAFYAGENDFERFLRDAE